MSTRLAALTLAAATLFAAVPLAGQSIAERILRTSGDVRLSFKPRPDVCGDGGPTIYMMDSSGQRRVHYSSSGNSRTIGSRYADEWAPVCEEGPVRVALTVDAGSVTSVRMYVGGQWRTAGTATDLGIVAARDAANALVALAEQSDRRSSDLLLAATLADSADTAAQLLRLARNHDLPRTTRRSAIFWLGQAAADQATTGLREIIDSDDDVDVRKHAVFSLSQLPRDKSVPILIDIVRKRGDSRIVKQAVFWLGQTDDPRAVALFEELLLTRK